MLYSYIVDNCTMSPNLTPTKNVFLSGFQVVSGVRIFDKKQKHKKGTQHFTTFLYHFNGIFQHCTFYHIFTPFLLHCHKFVVQKTLLIEYFTKIVLKRGGYWEK